MEFKKINTKYMTKEKAKEKAMELLAKCFSIHANLPLKKHWTISHDVQFNKSKDCAKIVVNELINDCDASSPFEEKRLRFWNDVLTEIDKY